MKILRDNRKPPQYKEKTINLDTLEVESIPMAIGTCSPCPRCGSRQQNGVNLHSCVDAISEIFERNDPEMKGVILIWPKETEDVIK